MLLDSCEQVFEAGRVVRNAHIQAGKFLSEKLKKNISNKLKQYGIIDPYNIWEPLSLDIDGIGIIKILKIIDININDTVFVDSGNVNKLLSDE